MANNNSTPTYPGQTNLAGDKRAQFLKVFSGEVLMTYEERNVVSPRIRTRNIQNGKSAQFPVVGRADALFHTAGVNIFDSGNSLLSQVAMAERVINIDNRLISAVLIDDLDEAMNHFDVRGPYATAIGRALAKRVDQLSIHTLILAARASSTITGLNGGGTVADVDMKTSGVALANALFAAAQMLDEKDVPEDNRWAVVSPKMYYNLIKDPSTSLVPLLNKDLSVGNGDFAQAKVAMCAGFTILKSNHIPAANITSGDSFFGTGGASAQGNVYYGDFSDSAGVCFHADAAGRLSLKGLGVESERMMQYQAWGTLGRLAQGMGILQPECAVELSVDA